jgi:SAM-dependent methyltransferase
MKLCDFVYEQSSKVFLPSVNPPASQEDLAYGDGSEEYLLRILEETSDLRNGSEQLQDKVKDWPSRYHLAQGRSNVFSVLEVAGDLKVLELGSGCGALSRYLGENCRSVDCIEGNYCRARVGRKRCSGLESVRVFCSDIFKTEFDADYDVATLIGVLEYAPVYYTASREQACIQLLRSAGSALKENGALIIAIENKIGIKYWAGARDDHTGKVYDSIHGYPYRRTPVTFSKNEIVKLLNEAGFDYYHFYYCFPDYKFATSVFSSLGSDERLYLHNWIDIPFLSYGIGREYRLHEGLALRTLSQAGLLRELANSFLIVASRNKTSGFLEPDWIAKKVAVYPRRRQYQCITTLKNPESPYVEKKLLDQPSDGATYKVDNNKLLKHSATNGRWHPGDLLLFDVYEAVLAKDFKAALIKFLKHFYELSMEQFYTGRQDDSDYPILRGQCYDFMPRNIIKNGSGHIFIDSEWSAEPDLSADYLLYRCIKNDIINTQYPAMREAIGKPEKFIINSIKTIFQQYTKKRYKQNRDLDKKMSQVTIMID